MKAQAIREKDADRSGRLSKFIRRIPLLTSVVLGFLWAFIYVFLGRLHAMWQMFDKGFPFLVASVLGIHPGWMTELTGVIFAFIDGAIVGGFVGWVFTSFLRKYTMSVCRKGG